MYTERQAIQDEMHFNRRMIQEHRDNNIELLKRLRELDERDMGDNVSYDGLKFLTEQLNETVGNIAQLIPKVSVSDVLTHVAKDVDKEQVIKENDIVVPKEEDLKKKKPEPLSRERTASLVVQIMAELKEAKIKIIEQEFYRRTGRKYVNFYEIMISTMKLFPGKLEKLKGGLYRYLGE